jgi:hypothetical protein
MQNLAMATFDRVDALVVMMRRARSKSEQDAILIRLESAIERLHEAIDMSCPGGCPLYGTSCGRVSFGESQCAA